MAGQDAVRVSQRVKIVDLETLEQIYNNCLSVVKEIIRESAFDRNEPDYAEAVSTRLKEIRKLRTEYESAYKFYAKKLAEDGQGSEGFVLFEEHTCTVDSLFNLTQLLRNELRQQGILNSTMLDNTVRSAREHIEFNPGRNDASSPISVYADVHEHAHRSATLVGDYQANTVMAMGAGTSAHETMGTATEVVYTNSHGLELNKQTIVSEAIKNAVHAPSFVPAQTLRPPVIGNTIDFSNAYASRHDIIAEGNHAAIMTNHLSGAIPKLKHIAADVPLMTSHQFYNATPAVHGHISRVDIEKSVPFENKNTVEKEAYSKFVKFPYESKHETLMHTRDPFKLDSKDAPFHWADYLATSGKQLQQAEANRLVKVPCDAQPKTVLPTRAAVTSVCSVTACTHTHVNAPHMHSHMYAAPTISNAGCGSTIVTSTNAHNYAANNDNRFEKVVNEP